MINTQTIKTANLQHSVTFNWPIVSLLFFLTAIPGIPAIFILLLVMLGPDAIDGVSSAINVTYFKTPAAIIAHGGAGILFFITMPLQFSPKLRQQKPILHKLMGRVAVLSGLGMAISGVWMHHVLSPEQLGMRYVSLVILSSAMCIAFILAIWHILKGNVMTHSKWMKRAVAITLASVTPLFFEAVISLLFADVKWLFSLFIQIQHDYGRLIAMVVNLMVVEYFIRKKTTG